MSTLNLSSNSGGAEGNDTDYGEHESAHSVTFLSSTLHRAPQQYCHPYPTVDLLSLYKVNGVTTPGGQRALEWYRLLAFPSRVWAIDSLKAFGDLTADELADEVPAGARRNMAKVHLPALQKAELIDSYVDEDGDTRYRATLGQPVDLDIDPDDDLLRRALMEFERVYTQRRIDRIRQWASEHWTKWSTKWAQAATTADYFEQATPEDLERFGDRLADAISELRAAAAKRQESGEKADEEPVFITVNCFPLRRGRQQ